MSIRSLPPKRVVAVDRRFTGPPDMANGGYVSGLVTGGEPAQVVFHRPVPLERPLTINRTSDGHTLSDGDGRLVTALTKPSVAVDLEFIEPNEIEGAAAPVGLDHHPFPRCFVCGPQRQAGDGMRIHPRPLGDRWAAVFTPPDDGGATVPVEYLTGALDCPTGFAVYGPGELGVLGTFEAAVTEKALTGEPLIVVSASRGHEGRRRYADSALFDTAGRRIGSARAIWVDLGPKL